MKHQSGQVKHMPCSRIQRRRARATFIRSCSAARRLFFEAPSLCRSKTCHTALRLPGIRRLRIAATICIQYKKSGWGSQSDASKKSACAHSSGRDDYRSASAPMSSGFMPPLHPFDCRTGAHVEPFCLASRGDAPELTRPLPRLRSRNSKEHGFGMDLSPENRINAAQIPSSKHPGNMPIQPSRNLL